MSFRDRWKSVRIPSAGRIRRREGGKQRARPSDAERSAREDRLRSNTSVVAGVLIVAILLWQSIEVSNNYARALSSPLWITPFAAWPALLALFGAIIASIARMRHDARYLAKRAVRWLASPWLSILLAAFVLGSATTLLPVSDYLTDPDVWNYVLNLVGWPHLALPGVFEFNNARGTVNFAVVMLPAAILTAFSAWLRLKNARLDIAVRLGLGLGLIAAGASGLVNDDWMRLTLSAAAGGQLGILASGHGRAWLAWRWAPWVFLGVLAALAGAGWVRPDLQPLAAAAAGPCAALLGLGLRSFRFGGPLLQFGKIDAATLAFAYPVQQLVSLTALGASAAGNAGVSIPLLIAAGWLVARSLRWMLPLDGDLPESLNLPAARLSPTRRFTIRPPSKVAREMAIIVMGLAAALIGLLAITIFAMQRSPW